MARPIKLATQRVQFDSVRMYFAWAAGSNGALLEESKKKQSKQSDCIIAQNTWKLHFASNSSELLCHGLQAEWTCLGEPSRCSVAIAQATVRRSRGADVEWHVCGRPEINKHCGSKGILAAKEVEQQKSAILCMIQKKNPATGTTRNLEVLKRLFGGIFPGRATDAVATSSRSRIARFQRARSGHDMMLHMNAHGVMVLVWLTEAKPKFMSSTFPHGYNP